MRRTAPTVESNTGKNAAKKITTMAGISPMPSHNTMNGSHATGEIGRRNCTTGFRNSQARVHQPITSPSRTANTHATTYPIKNRYMLAPTSNSNWPLSARSTRAPATEPGPGNRDEGNTPETASTCHIASSAANETAPFRTLLTMHTPSSLSPRTRRTWAGCRSGHTR